MRTYTTITFYKYIPIAEPQVLLKHLRDYCQQHNITGRILLGKEGINGGVSGTQEATEQFKHFIHEDERFADLTFREQIVEKQSYHKLVVREREEIVALGKEADLKHTGKHITPQELKTLLDNKEDIVLLDARNEYEAAIGKFKDAIVLPIKTFKEFPEEMEKHPELKDKKIVMYCTGGIRCEKSSAYLKEHGFKNVQQLQGGIINYVNQFPNTYYEGSCFVFDDRKTSKVSKGEAVSECALCGKHTDSYINCHNLACDKLFISCGSCQQAFNNTCSDKCKAAPRQRQEQLQVKEVPIGVVKNYYVHKHIALIQLTNKAIKKGMPLWFKGKTTKLFAQSITDLKHDDGTPLIEATAGQLVTVPVRQRVRKNDRVLLLN